jgi:hypothetical protein
VTILERPVILPPAEADVDAALGGLLAIAGAAIATTIADHRAAAARRARILELDGPASLAAFIEALPTW